MYMQTVMLLAVERGLDTCAQEAWSMYHRTVANFVELPAEYMVFSGMALGHADLADPINGWRARREPFEAFGVMRGFETHAERS
jgi:nitroreductase